LAPQKYLKNNRPGSLSVGAEEVDLCEARWEEKEAADFLASCFVRAIFED
jgi:hypothetical protein